MVSSASTLYSLMSSSEEIGGVVGQHALLLDELAHHKWAGHPSSANTLWLLMSRPLWAHHRKAFIFVAAAQFMS